MNLCKWLAEWGSREINLTKSYKGEEVDDSHDHPWFEGTWHIEEAFSESTSHHGHMTAQTLKILPMEHTPTQIWCFIEFLSSVQMTEAENLNNRNYGKFFLTHSTPRCRN